MGLAISAYLDDAENISRLANDTNKAFIGDDGYPDKVKVKEYIVANDYQIKVNLELMTEKIKGLTADQKNALNTIDNSIEFASREPSTWNSDDLETYRLLCENLKITDIIQDWDIDPFIEKYLGGVKSAENIKKAILAIATDTTVSPVDNKTVVPKDGTLGKIKTYAKTLYSNIFGSSEIKKSYITWANAKKTTGAVYPFFVVSGIITMVILYAYGISLPVAVQTTSESLSGCYMFVGSNDAVKLEGCSTWYGQSVDNQLLCKCGAKANSSTPPDCNTLTGECGAPYCIGRSCKPATQGNTACSYQRTPILQCSGTSSTDPNYIYYAYRQYPPSSLVAGAITTSPVINNYSSTTTSNINKIIMYIFIVIVILIVLFFGGKFILNKMNRGKGKIKNKK